jgi:FKBP-type peptidyl-prolyl cis-trans isomerase 2
MMAGTGDLVAVDYTGTLDDGTVFDTSIRDDAVKAGLPLRPQYAPLKFTIGKGELIAGFDKAAMGMKIGDQKQVSILPAEAYGPVQQNLIVAVPESQIQGTQIQMGSQLTDSDGNIGTIVAVQNGTVIVDMNHPLAGKTLNFRIIMRNITKPSN